jgi:hypothetical protein
VNPDRHTEADITHPANLTLADFMDPFPQVWELQRKQVRF